ncbi:MAG: HEAT repeat domain-containing protein [Methanosarcinales archaeon]|nr:HEAT repeat domain-containing protein [Methanosarcinales archaeon]
MDRAAELVLKLKSNDYFERQKAAWALVELGEEALDGLLDALKTCEHSHARYKAAWALGKIGDRRAVEPLSRSMIGDPDEAVREWCAAALDEMGSTSAVPALVQALRTDSHKEVRLRASAALSSLGASRAFREILEDESPLVRGMAVTGLSRLKCLEALEEVACRLGDQDREVRRRAAACLGEMAQESSVRYLGVALEDEEPQVREQVLHSLARIRGPEACRLAAGALRDPDERVRLAAVTALGEIGLADPLQALIEVMLGDDHEEIRAWAAWSLGEIRDPRAVGPLKEACASGPEPVRNKAMDSLREVFGLPP